MSILCPQCGSENCQSFAVLNAHGTSVSNTTSRSMLGKSHHHEVAQTAMGAATAPPARKGLKGKFWVTVVLWFLGITNVTGGAPFFLWVAFLFAGCIVAYFFVRAFQWNRTVWPQLYEEWNQQWLCNQCGTVFVPGAYASEAAPTLET